MLEGFITSSGLVYFNIANSHMINASVRRPMLTAQSNAGVVTPGKHLIILEIEGTEPGTDPDAGDPGVPRVYVDNVDVTAIVGAVSNTPHLRLT